MPALTLLVIVFASAQVVTQPKPVETVDPDYPEAARVYQIDGLASFRATISPEGTVSGVSILSVPRSNIGFESAIERAVRQWRFSPATLDGKPVIGSFVGQVRFVMPATLKDEVMYPRRSREVWTAVDKLLRDLGFRPDKRDESNQLWVTAPRAYRTGGLPDAAALGLTEPEVPQRLQLNVYVTPNLEPARVAIGSIVDAVALVPIEPGQRRRLATTMFSPPALNEWFLAQLSSALGVKPDAMAASPEGRAEQSRRLMPAGVTDACSTTSAGIFDGGATAQSFVQPRRIYDFRPPYPGRALADEKEAVVSIEADLTEHGTIARPSPNQGSGEFQVAAQQAVLLWRFAPARMDPCPVPVRFTVFVKFAIP